MTQFLRMRIFSLFLLLISTGCNQAIDIIDGKINNKSDAVSSIEENSATVDEPVAVAGAFLTCFSPPDNQVLKVSCQLFKNEAKQEIPEIEDLWLEDVITQARTEADFQITERYSIEITPRSDPGDNYQVLIKWADGESLAGEVNDDLGYIQQGNLVVDGSFELMLNGQDSTKFYSSGVHQAWDVEIGGNYGCTDPNGMQDPPQLEIQSSSTGDNTIPRSSEGIQHLELDSSCPSNGQVGGNVRVFLDINTIPGHRYSITFDARARDPSLGEEKYTVIFDDIEIHSAESDSTEWAKISLEAVVLNSTARIYFEEIGEPNSMGTLIDNVEIFDLGLNRNSDSDSDSE